MVSLISTVKSSQNPIAYTFSFFWLMWEFLDLWANMVASFNLPIRWSNDTHYRHSFHINKMQFVYRQLIYDIMYILQYQSWVAILTLFFFWQSVGILTRARYKKMHFAWDIMKWYLDYFEVQQYFYAHEWL